MDTPTIRGDCSFPNIEQDLSNHICWWLASTRFSITSRQGSNYYPAIHSDQHCQYRHQSITQWLLYCFKQFFCCLQVCCLFSLSFSIILFELNPFAIAIATFPISFSYLFYYQLQPCTDLITNAQWTIGK